MPVRRGKDGRWRYREVVSLPEGTTERISGSAPRECNTRMGAQRALHEHIEQLCNPRLVPSTPAKKEVPTLEEFTEEFLENYVRANNKPVEYRSKKQVLESHLIPAFGDKRLDEIKPRLLEAYKAQKLRDGRVVKRRDGRQGLDWKTVNNHLTILRRMLVIAKKWEIIDSVPDIQWLKGAKPEFDFLDFEEADRLIAAADEEWRPMIVLALKTGMRQGELLALRWDDVDLHKGLLVVRQNIVRGIVGTPKSGKGREIPLSDQAVSALKSHRHLRGELVFCDAGGDYFKKNECKHPLWRACKRAGIRRIGWHMLRHTFASHLAMRGVPLKAIQELLGHSTIEMTMRYSHLSPNVTRNAVQTLDELPPNYAEARGKNMAKTTI